MGIPAWGWALGSLIEGPKVAGNLFDLYKGIRDDSVNQQNLAWQRQAAPDLEGFRQGYENIAGPSMRFLADPESLAELEKAGLKLPASVATNPYVLKGIRDIRTKAQEQSDLADMISGGANADTLSRLGTMDAAHLTAFQKTADDYQTDQIAKKAAAAAADTGQNLYEFMRDNPAVVPPRLGQSFHNLISLLQTGTEKDKELALKNQDRGNVSQIMAMAPDLMRPDLSGTNAGRYPRSEEVMSDLGALIRDYPVTSGSADKVIDDTRQQMQNSFSSTPTYIPVPGEGGKGKDMVAVLQNLYGLAPHKLDVNRGAKTTINMGGGAKTGDLVTAYKAELGGVMSEVKQWLNPSEQQMDPQDLLAAIKTGKAGQSIPEEARRGLLQKTQDISNIYVPVIRRSVGVSQKKPAAGTPAPAAVPAATPVAVDPGSRPPITSFFRQR